MTLLSVLNNYNPTNLRVNRPIGKALERVAKELERYAEGLDAALLEPPKEISEEVAKLLRIGENNISRKHLKLVAAGGMEYISNQPDAETLLERFLKLILDSGSSLLFKSLLLGYLRISQNNLFLITNLRKILLKKKNTLPKRWVDRIDKFDLLNENIGASLANRILVNQDSDPAEILEEAGFKRGLLLGGGYSEAIFKCIVAELARGHHDRSLSRFMELAEKKWPDGSFLYPFTSPQTGDIAAIGNELLNPYIKETPREDLRKRIEDFLLERFEDPRVNHRRWSRVSQEHIDVLSRWLTKESFEMLMKILKRSNNTGQWKDRSKFWGYYLENDYVTDAWVILGPEASNHAHKLIADGTLKSRSSYGVLSRSSYSSIQPIHSVILMKIGDLIISEWTHDGKIRIYHADNEKKQQFYKSSYTPSNLRSDTAPNFFKSHLGNWQLDIENYIYRSTGIPGPSRGGNRSIPTQTINLMKEVFCQQCNQPKAERWLNAFGICHECSDGKVRIR